MSEINTIRQMREERKTLQQIADAIGRDRAGVAMQVKRHGMRRRTHAKVSHDEHLAIVGMVHSGISIRRVAKMVGRTDATVRNHVRWFEKREGWKIGEHRREYER